MGYPSLLVWRPLAVLLHVCYLTCWFNRLGPTQRHRARIFAHFLPTFVHVLYGVVFDPACSSEDLTAAVDISSQNEFEGLLFIGSFDRLIGHLKGNGPSCIMVASPLDLPAFCNLSLESLSILTPMSNMRTRRLPLALPPV